MCAEINVYPIRKKSGFDVSKSRIFAFQKSINAIFNIESNVEISIKTRRNSSDLNQLRLKFTEDSESSWSITNKAAKLLPESSEVNITDTNVGNNGEPSSVNMKISNNMDNLLHYFNSIHDYPEYYLGKAEKIALCRCPQTGKETWNNGKILLIAEPRKNMIVKAQLKIKDTIYEKEFIFVKWETENFYEWRMKSGNILQLRQQYIDGLLPKDKKYLRMHT